MRREGKSDGSWIRPELVAACAAVLLLPVVAILAYKGVSFQLAYFFDNIAVHPCTFQAKTQNGHTLQWDMSALPRAKSKCQTARCRDYAVAREDEVFYLNICGNTMNKPRECRQLYGGESRVPTSMGYQVRLSPAWSARALLSL